MTCVANLWKVDGHTRARQECNRQLGQKKSVGLASSHHGLVASDLDLTLRSLDLHTLPRCAESSAHTEEGVFAPFLLDHESLNGGII